MKTYKTSFITVDDDNKSMEDNLKIKLETELNNAAKEGWQVVSITTFSYRLRLPIVPAGITTGLIVLFET